MSKKVEKRTCRLCNEKKSIDSFEIDKRVKGGYTTRCKTCKAGLNDRARVLYSNLKRRGRDIEVTLKELRAILAAFDGKCIYCNASEDDTGTTHHIDHIIPLSEGGRNHKSNLVVACDPCNRSKGNAPFIDFYLRKKKEISDDNFNLLIHYVALMSQQPTDEVLAGFVVDYKVSLYRHLTEFMSEQEVRDIMETVVNEHIEERTS